VQKNELVLSPGVFSNTTSLKVLLLGRNNIRRLYKDIEHCGELTKLDLSNNRMTHLAPELVCPFSTSQPLTMSMLSVLYSQPFCPAWMVLPSLPPINSPLPLFG
jgi:Leucine-rich repeat (LRR) protein